ncbi:MAG: mitochondrial fission ELM1 family protein [Aestuariivirga sp.]|uniref:ELM1/GtrOC1 family putative glycosyltransferase n=1 Tax=Aestuariivirga sp. TaxID=2650926 RepID=UPI0025BB34DD|nr:ELM1/GtrOC1 family putative glycosyltransferase [Aestuariivirga sp.]MCA3560979.1 mitochondrial fission ELM1 family protein [Aestuariivirga sp.]
MTVLWVLTGPKSGDNGQVMNAAKASGLPFETRHIVFDSAHLGRKPVVRASLDGVDAERSDRLCGPWPGIVLVIGRRLSCVALWIKKQSGGATRIALFNAPKGRARDFDLVVLPPYYRKQKCASALSIRAPLTGIDPLRIAQAGNELAQALGAGQRPIHVLLVGGDMGQRKLEPGFVAGIYRQMRDGFAAGGAIHVSTSPRTPPRVVETLRPMLRPQDCLHAWRPDATANTYLGLLAHGESFTVTADSLSMLIEVARLGKPLVIAEPPRRHGLAGLKDWASGLLRPRDLRHALRMLYSGGYAVPLGMPPQPCRGLLPDDTGLVADRLRLLAGAEAEQVIRHCPAVPTAGPLTQ